MNERPPGATGCAEQSAEPEPGQARLQVIVGRTCDQRLVLYRRFLWRGRGPPGLVHPLSGSVSPAIAASGGML